MTDQGRTYRLLSTDVEMDRTPTQVIRWYDRSLKLWTGFAANAIGDQLSECDYQHYKKDIEMDHTKWTLIY